jgi:soluble lytic murein transglycosylase-like protein
VLLLPLLLLLHLPLKSHARGLPPPAYQFAATDQGVPSDVLYALALAESGLRIDKRIRPWPWTLNVAGQGRFFRSRADACATLLEVLQHTPAKRVDIGLGQINYGYHGQRVTHPCELLDPYLNLSIAAAILKTHYRSAEGWLAATGRYHFPAGGERARRYRLAVQNHLAQIHTPARSGRRKP